MPETNTNTVNTYAESSSPGSAVPGVTATHNRWFHLNLTRSGT